MTDLQWSALFLFLSAGCLLIGGLVILVGGWIFRESIRDRSPDATSVAALPATPTTE